MRNWPGGAERRGAVAAAQVSGGGSAGRGGRGRCGCGGRCGPARRRRGAGARMHMSKARSLPQRRCAWVGQGSAEPARPALPEAIRTRTAGGSPPPIPPASGFAAAGWPGAGVMLGHGEPFRKVAAGGGRGGGPPLRGAGPAERCSILPGLWLRGARGAARLDVPLCGAAAPGCRRGALPAAGRWQRGPRAGTGSSPRGGRLWGCSGAGGRGAPGFGWPWKWRRGRPGGGSAGGGCEGAGPAALPHNGAPGGQGRARPSQRLFLAPCREEAGRTVRAGRGSRRTGWSPSKRFGVPLCEGIAAVTGLERCCYCSVCRQRILLLPETIE